jgi:hypothetical protein
MFFLAVKVFFLTVKVSFPLFVPKKFKKLKKICLTYANTTFWNQCWGGLLALVANHY